MVALREQPTARAVPYLPTQSGYNKRLRAATGMLRAVIAHLVACTSRCTDDEWAVDLTPVECGRSRETTKRSDLTGWAKRDADPNLLATHPGQTFMADRTTTAGIRSRARDAWAHCDRPVSNTPPP